jgi:hypothetical protein
VGSSFIQLEALNARREGRQRKEYKEIQRNKKYFGGNKLTVLSGKISELHFESFPFSAQSLGSKSP